MQLHEICRNINHSYLEALIAAGGSIEALYTLAPFSIPIRPFLTEAMRRNDLVYAKKVLSKNRCMDINELNREGDTPLSETVAAKDFKACKFLIELGADVNNKGHKGIAALHYAAIHKSPKFCKTLIKAGANVNIKADVGRTPLFIASYKGNVEVCKFLIRAGADIHCKDALGETPLMWAKSKKNNEIVKILTRFSPTYGGYGFLEEGY